MIGVEFNAKRPFGTAVLAAFLSLGIAGEAAAQTAAWNSQATGAYLENRIQWWMDWPQAARDHGTFCVSCHTAAPYAVARTAMRAGGAPTAAEQRMLDNIIKRVRMWNEVAPFYPTKTESDPKTVESRGTESVLNALILARNDALAGKLSADGRLALGNMWGEQLKSGDTAGAWPWLQFHNSPWEGDSQFYGSALAAIAIGSAPDGYRDSPGIAEGRKLLTAYLSRGEPSQKLIDRVTVLWAATKLPGLLPAERRNAIVEDALAKQRPDGGFSLSDFVGDWKRRDKTPLAAEGDGYATGLVAYALEQNGTARTDPHLSRALDWLKANQQPDGSWLAWSLNKQRDPTTDAAKFMGDAATAYAALALSTAR